MSEIAEKRQAPATRGGLSRSLVTDRFFLISASWPSLVIMLAVTAIPFALSIALSLTNYDLVRSDSWKFIGLGNFADLIGDPHTPTVVFNTAYLVIGSTVACTTVGLALALLMESAFRGIGLIRSLYLVPIMTAPVVVALTWRAMFNNDAGWINYFLSLLHLPQPVWLGDPLLAMPAVIISDMWTGVPFMAVLLLAGLLAVPRDLKQAAEVDGASSRQIFRHVTLPSIRPVLFIAIVLKFIDGFRKFEGIQILTTGGPGYASTTLNLHIYTTGLEYDQVGYAATFGVVMVAMIAVSISLLYFAIGRER
jgi:multiple sugar transport system permease protein